MRIVFFLDTFYPQINGVVTSSHNTIKELARRGHQVIVVAPRPLKPRKLDKHAWLMEHGALKLFLIPGIEAFFYPDFVFTAVFSARVYRALKQFSPDIIHFHSQMTLGIMAVLMARKLQVPLIGSFHTFFAEPEYLANVALFRRLGLHKSRWLVRLAWFINNKFFYQKCQAVVAVGEFPRQALMGRGLSGRRIKLVYNGVFIRQYGILAQAGPAQTKQGKLGFILEPGKTYLVYLGRISVEKSLDVLARAVKHVMQNRSEVNWLILGHGPYERELKRLIRSLGIGDRTLMPGAVPNRVLLESGILSRCRLLVTASKSEAQPISIIEGMMFGLPAVGVDARGVRDVLKAGNGLLVGPDQPAELAGAILRLLENQKLYSQILAKIRRNLGRYNIEITTENMLGVYRQAIRQGNQKEIIGGIYGL